ncbi:MAG: hypothetical protein QW776_02140 [Candidatus Nitrosocaldus sp.]
MEEKQVQNYKEKESNSEMSNDKNRIIILGTDHTNNAITISNYQDQKKKNKKSITTLISIGNYKIVRDKDKSALKIHGKKWYTLSYAKHWRKDIIENYLKLNKKLLMRNAYNNEVDWFVIARVLVAFEAVNSARDYKNAIHLLDALNNMEYGDVYFWASQFISVKGRARRAFRILYSKR